MDAVTAGRSMQSSMSDSLEASLPLVAALTLACLALGWLAIRSSKMSRSLPPAPDAARPDNDGHTTPAEVDSTGDAKLTDTTTAGGGVQAQAPGPSQTSPAADGTPTTSTPASPESTDMSVMTSMTMATIVVLENLDGALQDHHVKHQSAILSGVRKELASILNQRPPATISDMKALGLEIQNARSEIKTLQDEVKEIHKLVVDTHQSTLDARVELKTEADRHEDSLAAIDHKFDSEVTFLNSKLDAAATKMDQIGTDVRNIHMVIPYIQNAQVAIDDAQWHIREVYNKTYMQNNILENTRLLGEATEEQDTALAKIKEMIEELLSRLLPASTTPAPRAQQPPPSQAHMPPPLHTANVTARPCGPTGGNQPCPLDLTSALQYKAPPPSAPPTSPAPQTLDRHTLTLTPDDLARLLLVLQQSQALAIRQ
ncbi:unnamed protein product [Symbiodinium sp. CCMP2592]|nr:unnamed protein product [Symbiodinium sp. CCMP2592]